MTHWSCAACVVTDALSGSTRTVTAPGVATLLVVVGNVSRLSRLLCSRSVAVCFVIV